MSIVYQDLIELEAPPETVREFIVTPERILDYYPGGIDGGVIETGAAIYCRSEASVSLLQVDQAASTPDTLVLDVFTAGELAPPYSADRIRDGAFFSMVEDWHLEPNGVGTRLIKTWRDIRQYGVDSLPIETMVVEGAKSESEALRSNWNRAFTQLAG